jgi:hypothetical protein
MVSLGIALIKAKRQPIAVSRGSESALLDLFHWAGSTDYSTAL